MLQTISNIVNDRSFRNKQCINDNERHQQSFGRHAQVTNEARAVCRKIGSDQSFELYCKAFYKLSPATIWDCVELAIEKGRSPERYLTWLLVQKLNKSI